MSSGKKKNFIRPCCPVNEDEDIANNLLATE